MTTDTQSKKLAMSPYWVRWLFRAIAAVAIVQSVGGIVTMFTRPEGPWWVALWVAGVFTLCAILLWTKQPQFAALFALFASAYVEPILAGNEQPYAPLILLIPVLLWGLLFQHPIALPARFQTAGVGGLLIAAILTTLMAFEILNSPLDSPNPAIAGAFYGWAAVALIVLTQRCISAGLYRSPRTLIFALSIAPLVLGILAEYAFKIDRISDLAKAVVALCFTIAPIGTLLTALAQKTKTISPEAAAHGRRSSKLEHHR